MIVKGGDPVLRELCAPVTPAEGAAVGQRLRQEFGGVGAEIGLGLAAPQIGEAVRVFVLRGWPDPFINPEPVSYGEASNVMVESCLSLPGVKVPVRRPTTIKITAERPGGGIRTFKLRGLDARAAQHELDHLDGKLITDYKE